MPGGRQRTVLAGIIAATAGTALFAAAMASSAGTPSALDPSPSPAPSGASPTASSSPLPAPSSSGLPLPVESSPEPTFEPSPSPMPTPVPLALETTAIVVPLGHLDRVRVVAPASGILTLSGFDGGIVSASFNGIDRTIDVAGLHAGVTSIAVADQAGDTLTLQAAVEPYAGKAYDAAEQIITGDPASADFVSEEAAAAAQSVAYPLPGAAVSIPDLTGVRPLDADDIEDLRVPLAIDGPDLYPYRQTVDVTVRNIAQPHVAAKYLLVSDFPETIEENGTLFYADVNPDAPARLLYYHYAAAGSPLRRVLVKVQNNGVDASLIELTAGISGPDQNVLLVGHESTKRFLMREAAGEGEIFEVPPGATINLVDQLLPALSLVSGLMQVRVVQGDGVRLAVVVQDATDSPVEPISDTLLSSAVRHARGVYQVPDFIYDEDYTIGDPPTVLNIGRLPLPNLVQGEVLGGDYGVKQSATVTLLNTGADDASVGMWLQPRGGRATATFLIDGSLAEVRATNAGSYALVRTFPVPAHGYRRVEIVTMPEGGSSYPVNLLFSSGAPN
jgi:hypothetical protein